MLVFGTSKGVNVNSVTTSNINESSQYIDKNGVLKTEVTEQKYPGCFKKTVAFLIDQIIITIISIAIFFPFSSVIGSLNQHGWIVGYLLGAVYFIILESFVLKGQSIGKKLFACKVKTIEGEDISAIVSFGRYLLITFPFMNGAFSNSLATTVGITNTLVGGTVFLIIVGLLLAGNTIFMLFHPQKRGLHDIVFKTVVVPSDYKPNTLIHNFTTKPIISGIIGLVFLSVVFSNLFFKVGRNSDFSDINELTNKIRQESLIQNISASYRTFSMNGKQTMFAIEVHVPIPYDKFNDKDYTEELSNKLYPLAKKANTNPNVNTISMVFHTQKYIGAFPIKKTSRNPKKLTEIN